MGKTKDYLDYLNNEMGISPASSQEELDCAQSLAGIFSSHGLEPQVQEFAASAMGPMAYGIAMVLMFVGVLLAGIGGIPTLLVGLILAALGIVSLAMTYRGNDVLSKIGPRCHSQNVVALRPAEVDKREQERPIVIIAHYDTPRTDLLSRPGVCVAKRYLAQFGPYCVCDAAVCTLLQILLFLPEPLRRVLWVVGIIASLPILAWGVTLIAARFLPFTTGAVDNKSSVAAMLGILDHICEGTVPVRVPRDELAEDEGQFEDGIDDGSQQGGLVPGGSDNASQAGTGGRAARSREDLVREEVEETIGVRHGEQVLRTLGVLPEDCEITYIEPEVRLVPVPAEELAREWGAMDVSEPSAEEELPPADADTEVVAPVAIPASADGAEAVSVPAEEPDEGEEDDEDETFPELDSGAAVAPQPLTPRRSVAGGIEPENPYQSDEPEESTLDAVKHGVLVVFGVLKTVFAKIAEGVKFLVAEVKELIEEHRAAKAEAPEEEAPATGEDGEVSIPGLIPLDTPYESIEDEEAGDASESDTVSMDAQELAESDASYGEDASSLGETIAMQPLAEDNAEGDAEATLPMSPVSAEGCIDTEGSTGVVSVSKRMEALAEAADGAKAAGESPAEPAAETDAVDEPATEDGDTGEETPSEPAADDKATAVDDETAALAARLSQLENGEATDEGPVTETDQSGLSTMVEEDANAASEAERPERPIPAAIDDPEWGKSSFVPASRKASQATLAMPKVDAGASAAAPACATASAPTTAATSSTAVPAANSRSFASQIPVVRLDEQSLPTRADARNVARRASLFDLPDPLSSENDSLAPVIPFPGTTTASQEAATRETSAASDPDATVIVQRTAPEAASDEAPASLPVQGDVVPVQSVDVAGSSSPQNDSQRKKRRFGLFGRKEKQQEESMSEWLGVDEDYNAKESGESIGSWDNFNDDHGHWKGGATRSAELREAEAAARQAATESLGADGAQGAVEPHGPADLPASSAGEASVYERNPYVAVDAADAAEAPTNATVGGERGLAPVDEELRDAILAIDDETLRLHDVWFVATGASALGHAGAKQFVEEHRRDIRGSFIVNLENVGAGYLTMLTHEGFGSVRRADRRCSGLLAKVADDLHIPLSSKDRSWADTEATPIMRKSLRGVTIMGLGEGDLPALSHTEDDIPENVDVAQVEDVVALVTEMIRRA